jgi:parvulin-like peptidyl-prolyl isomerase
MALKVNGEQIPEQAILMEMKRLMDFYAQHMSREELGRHAPLLLKRAKEQAIGMKLLVEEARRLRIEIPDADVEASCQKMVHDVGGDARLEEMLDRQGLTRQQLKNSIRVGKQIDKLVTQITTSATPCTDEEIRAYYERHADRYVGPDRAQVRHILMRPASEDEADKEVVRSQLLELKARAEEGTDFAQLAAAYSECPSGRQTGGSLGWVKRGTTVPVFDQVIFAMEVDEISGVVETPLGSHIVQKLAQEPGAPLAFEAVRERIRDLLMHERKGRAISQYVERLRANVTVEDDDERALPTDVDGVFDSFLDADNAN